MRKRKGRKFTFRRSNCPRKTRKVREYKGRGRVFLNGENSAKGENWRTRAANKPSNTNTAKTRQRIIDIPGYRSLTAAFYSPSLEQTIMELRGSSKA